MHLNWHDQKGLSLSSLLSIRRLSYLETRSQKRNGQNKRRIKAIGRIQRESFVTERKQQREQISFFLFFCYFGLFLYHRVTGAKLNHPFFLCVYYISIIASHSSFLERDNAEFRTYRKPLNIFLYISHVMVDNDPSSLPPQSFKYNQCVHTHTHTVHRPLW